MIEKSFPISKIFWKLENGNWKFSSILYRKTNFQFLFTCKRTILYMKSPISNFHFPISFSSNTPQVNESKHIIYNLPFVLKNTHRVTHPFETNNKLTFPIFGQCNHRAGGPKRMATSNVGPFA